MPFALLCLAPADEIGFPYDPSSSLYARKATNVRDSLARSVTDPSPSIDTHLAAVKMTCVIGIASGKRVDAKGEDS